MKHILFFIFCLTAFVSCSTVKKAKQSNTKENDSLYVKANAEAKVSVIDSVGKKEATTNEKTKEVSQYTKKTVIKEYFSSDTIPVISLKDSAKQVRQPGKLLYRETTISESGKKEENTEKQSENKQQTALTSSDSTHKDKAEFVHVVEKKKDVSTAKSSKRVSLVFVGGCIVAFVFLLLFFYFKRRF